MYTYTSCFVQSYRAPDVVTLLVLWSWQMLFIRTHAHYIHTAYWNCCTYCVHGLATGLCISCLYVNLTEMCCWGVLRLCYQEQTRTAVANRWSARKFWWPVEKFGHYLQFLCILYCFIIFWFVFVSPTQDRWQFSPYCVESNFILIKWKFYDHYFIDVCTFLKKIHVSGPRDSKLWI
jgi:hypothetical protein